MKNNEYCLSHSLFWIQYSIFALRRSEGSIPSAATIFSSANADVTTWKERLALDQKAAGSIPAVLRSVAQ